jgi:hypothetical protein
VSLGRDLMIALALFAAVVRALVPQGFMLSVADGQPSVVICTADGSRTLTGEATDRHKDGDVLAGMNGPCAFAGLAAMAPPPSAPILSLDHAIALSRVVVDESRPPAGAVSHRPQAPRGPPTLQA